MATLLQKVSFMFHLHFHRFCSFVYRCYPQIDSVLFRQMKCSTEGPPLEVTENCRAPPHLSQSFVACEWGSHSLHPDASSFPYCQVKLLRLWPTRQVSAVFVTMKGGDSCMPPLKVPGVSHFLITSLLCNLYTII
jgi:hypothetical protein